MEPLLFVSVVGLIYLVAFFFDSFFKSCMHYPYDAFLRNTGLTIKFLRFTWFTTAFNRSLFRWGSACKKLLIPAFSVGVVVALSLLPLGLILLFMTLFNDSSSVGDGVASPKIEILLPGVNLPLEEIGFYVSTLLVTTVVHELGHALAAVIEDVPVLGFGLQVYFCVPVAYTEISSEHLNSLKWWKKLRILCGGIWHNAVLSLVCYLLFSALGLFAAPFYHMNDAVVVTEIKPQSPLLGERGLFADDIVTTINDCRVQNMDSWYDCLVQSIRTKPGFCVSSDFIHLNDESVRLASHHTDGLVQCCDAHNTKQCCFEYVDEQSNDDPIEIPQHVCLDVRLTIEKAYGFCAGSCERGFCMRPLLNNATTVINIRRKAKDEVIYVGHPADISRSVKVSPFVPKTTYLPPAVGDCILLFLKYNVVFSLGLAVINAIPCFSLDGHHISGTIINHFLVNRVAERPKREIIVLLVNGMGTLLFLFAVLKVLWVSFLTDLL